MSQQDEQNWLVKSGGRILGPFSLIKVKELVRSKELVLLDEICLPCKRWLYIRDTEEFTDLVEEIRQLELRQVGGEDTVTVGMLNDELTASVTEASEEQLDDSLTGEIEGVEFDVINAVDLDKEFVAEKRKSARPVAQDVPRYGTVSAVQGEAKTIRQWGWIIALIVMVSAGTYLSVDKLVNVPLTLDSRFKNNLKAGSAALWVGNFEKALDFFEIAYELKPLDKSVHLPLGVLQIKIARQTVAGKRLLEKVFDYDAKLKKHAFTGIGLADLIDGEVRYAQKNFDLALKLDSKFTSAMINKGISYFQQRKFKSARILFERALKTKKSEDNSAVILLANNHLHAWHAAKNNTHLDSAKVLLGDFVKKNYDYRQEAFFLLAYISFLQKQTDKMQKYAERLLNTDPDLTSRFKHDLYIYNDIISWAAFLPWCNGIYEGHKTLEYIAALNAFCLVKSGKLKKAESRIVESINRWPKHSLVSGLNSYILNASGRPEEASIALGHANEYNKGNKKYYQPMVLQAWFCQDNEDYECALESWFKILEVKPSDLQAKVNVAIIRSKKGIKISPKDAEALERRFGNYIPLRRLKDQYGRQNI